MGIGDNIRELRKRKGLSQAELAKRMDVAKETVSRWESGRTFIRKTHLEKLVATFNVPVDDILSEEWGVGRELTARDTTAGQSEPLEADSQTTFPVYKVERSGNGTTLRHFSHAYAPPDVAQRHPAAFFVRMDYREMTKLYPVGSLLLVNQRMKPYNGCSVVALVDNSTVVIRRYLSGNNTVVLSSWSYDAPAPDLMLDKRRVRVLGVVVWFQGSHDLDA